MGIARYLSKLASGLSSEGVVSAAKGGTGSTSGATGGGGPKITAITVTDSSYNNLDDTAVDVAGGYIKLTGSGFASGCQVLVGSTPATSTTFVSSTEVRAQVPATTAGTYIVYLVNSDGGVAIRVNGVTFSTTPTWTTGSGLSAPVNSQISIQLAATGASTFSVASGSSLPSGVSLSSSGLLSGSITGLTSPTTYTFTILATDAELQDSPQTFSFSISVGEPYFKYTTLLLSADGSNAAQNNTFLDSSTNNFTITRNGNTTQGTFSPYGPNWSNYFDGSGDYFTVPSSSNFTFTGDFTIEMWVFVPTGYFQTIQRLVSSANPSSPAGACYFSLGNDNGIGAGYLCAAVNLTSPYSLASGNPLFWSSTLLPVGQWTHVALVRSGSSCVIYQGGVSVASTTNSATWDFNNSYGLRVSGTGWASTTENFQGNISNLRIVKGTAVYTSNFTPSTTPLTAISGTSLLTCQSNRFIDNSTNNYTITRNGDTSVQRFSPFSPGSVYSTSVIGGSGYFDGSGDYLTVPSSSAFTFGTGDFTVEGWVYVTAHNGAGANGIFQQGTTSFPLSTTNTVAFGTVSSGQVWQIYANNTNTNSSATWAFNTWYHFAVVRSSGTTKLYINGVAVITVASDTTNYTGTYFGIGSIYGTGYSQLGYISDLRVVKGTAVYTTTFTPPTAPLTAIANTQLLLNYTNAGIIDSAMMNNLETVGDAKISTTQSKFGGSSIYFDGTGDWLVCQDSPNQEFGAGNLTWEMWVNTASTTEYATLYSRTPASFLTGMWSWMMNKSSSTAGDLALYVADYSTSSPLLLTTGVNIRDSAWHHIAVVRNGSAWAIYVDGTSRATATWAGTIADIAGSPYIGADQYYGRAFTGYIDDLRITKGYARYTSNFTPPTSAHSAQ